MVRRTPKSWLEAAWEIWPNGVNLYSASLISLSLSYFNFTLLLLLLLNIYLLFYFLQRQAPQSSALTALMSFSVKLSDMERQITSYEKTIQRQKAEIDQLTAKLDSKADRVQFKSLQTLLDSKMVALKDETNTKDLLIERYRNKLSQLDSEVTVRGLNPSFFFIKAQGQRWGLEKRSGWKTVIISLTS